MLILNFILLAISLHFYFWDLLRESYKQYEFIVIFGLMVVLTLYFLQCHFGIATYAHKKYIFHYIPVAVVFLVKNDFFNSCQSQWMESTKQYWW